MITLAKVTPSRPDLVPAVEWRPRDRKIAKQATGRARPWLIRYRWVASEQAQPGHDAVFVDDRWPKVVHYTGTEEEARAAAQADLARLNDPDLERRCYLGRRVDSYYWSVT